MDNILDFKSKLEELNNKNLSTHMAIDLLNDCIKDLQTFENMEEMQEAIMALKLAKVQLKSRLKT